MAVSSHNIDGEVRVQLSLGHRERAIAALGEEVGAAEYLSEGSSIDLRLGAYEEALMSGNPGQALIGARTLLMHAPKLPFIWWAAKSLEGRALLDLGFYDEAMQEIDPGLLRTQRNQFWWYDTLLTLAWVHLFRGEWREVRRAVVPRLLLCQLSGFAPWFQGQGNLLLGLTAQDPVARRLHFLQASEAFERSGQIAVYPSSWKAENLYFSAVAAFEASGETDPSPLARAKLLLNAPEWVSETFLPVKEALSRQLTSARGGEMDPPSGRVPRRYLANLERFAVGSVSVYL
ncbi:MAG: hypothetical protein KGJ23_06765 [Euryarchaeota archaeon]|nr:hypothetical protein [Euryarchaeota archaeon]MDE1836301.1 hypothetical protein [Euryarchaeota archaeon]MDE1879099.1 hypothetical protein [Euryarchaeota archaeon]MDE2044303.1 hypothetical protein [Thermoplasmata archaeon]